MARRINIGQIGNFCEGQMNQLVHAVVFEADAELKAQSPVDTGRFRASWVIGENATGNYDAGAQQTSTGENVGKTEPPETPKPTPPTGINYRPGNERIGNTYSIHNSLPYAEQLAYQNWSTQAAAGWVDIIARQMTNRAKQLADTIGRNS
jgi:hypothetical protein